MPVPLTLCDRSPDMIAAWRRYFSDESGVKIANQNILTLNVDALAVPANAFGFTDGGIDMAISREVFDWRLQDTLHALIEREHGGELLVGQALVMSTGSSRFRYVVVAPTMRVTNRFRINLVEPVIRRHFSGDVQDHASKRVALVCVGIYPPIRL